RLCHGNTLVSAGNPYGLPNRKEWSDRLDERESCQCHILVHNLHGDLRQDARDRTANLHDLAQEVRRMHIQERSTEFWKVIGLYPESMLFGCFNRELTHVGEWAYHSISRLLFALLQSDPPVPLGSNRLTHSGIAGASEPGGAGISHWPRSVSRHDSARED